jgi:protein SCO1/2
MGGCAMMSSLHRRQFLVALSVLSMGSASADIFNFKKIIPSFNGIDITGVTYCRDFHLRAPDGSYKSLASFKGKYVMLFFGYTQCPDVCPTALARATLLMQKLGADAKYLQVIFITIDPERDNPALLKQYTAQFNSTFLGLSGDLKQTRQVASEFRVFYSKVPNRRSNTMDYTMDHSTLTYLFDPQGKIRLAMRHEHTADQFLSDIRQLMNEHPSS